MTLGASKADTAPEEVEVSEAELVDELDEKDDREELSATVASAEAEPDDLLAADLASK